jgi:hypothetical protein
MINRAKRIKRLKTFSTEAVATLNNPLKQENVFDYFLKIRLLK